MRNHQVKGLVTKVFTREYFRRGFQEWKNELFQYKYLIFLSLIIVGVAAFMDFFAGVYVRGAETADVPDLILDHIGPYDWGWLFVYGYLGLVFALFLYPMFLHIRTLHIVMSQFSLLVMLRAIFMIFTHLATPLDAIEVSFPWVFKGLSFENDMFFSGHTAIPFLGFFLFKGSKVRYFFLIGSICMAVSALVMHRHYSIDVFAAYFMTYCSHKIGRVLIRKIDPTY